MTDADYQFALELQKKLDEELSNDEPEEVSFRVPSSSKSALPTIKPKASDTADYLNETQNIVHPEWEILDPTPDIHSLFVAFDSKFFQGRLKCVTLEWSKKMYSCAGICYSRKNRFGMSITIRLSEPLLKLRPRKNLVETMLHEMIHAYCFVLNIREGNGGHGPNFKKIMNAINQVAGTNITVYHTFHDEVALYKQHVWRCNGICQNRAPFFGYVKRTSNRAPGPNDQWWAAHVESCGGYFQKIQEPEKKKKETAVKKKDIKPAGTGDLRNYFDLTKGSAANKKPIAPTNGSNIKGLNDNPSIKGPIKTNGGGTLLLNPRTTVPSSTGNTSISKAFPPTSYPGLSSDPFNTEIPKKTSSRTVVGGNLANVKGFRDLGSSDEGGGNSGRAISGYPASSQQAMTGRGYSLDSTVTPSIATSSSSKSDGSVDRNHLRNIWAKRFEKPQDTEKTGASKDDSNKFKAAGEAKRRRTTTDEEHIQTNDDIVVIDNENRNKKIKWNALDDDIMMADPAPFETISISSDDESDSDDVRSIRSTSPLPMQKRKPLTADERQIIIKKEILDDTDDLNDEDIVLIDDEYDDAQENLNLTVAAELADTSIIDEFFGDDTLLKEFKDENDLKPSCSRRPMNPEDDIVTCPICQQKFKRKFLDEHLDGCTGIFIRAKPPAKKLAKYPMPSARPGHRPPGRKTKKQILRDAGYTEQDLLNITSSSNEEDELSFYPNSQNNTTPRQINNETSPQASRQKGLYKTTRECPVCFEEVPENEINSHLDDCLSSSEQNRRKSKKIN